MPRAMTLETAKETDLGHDDATVLKAEQDAQAADEAAATLENSAIEGGKGSAAPAAVVEQRAVAEFARQRATRMRDRADKAKEARRLLQLEQVGKDAEAFAATTVASDSPVRAAVLKIAAAREELFAAAEEHNAKVRELANRGHALGATPQPNNGVLRADSAYVHIGFGGGIRTRGAAVHTVDVQQAHRAATLAASGQSDSLPTALGAIGTLAQTFGQPKDQHP